MAITSENNKSIFRIQYKSTHFRYAITYVIITLVVLLFLNIYSSKISQEVFYNSKKTSMFEKCHLAAEEIGKLEVINPRTVSKVISGFTSLNSNRLIVTDHNGISIYDSQPNTSMGEYILFPEVYQALKINNAFSWNYKDGSMQSRAATPIMSYGTLVGCIYIMEYDDQQGTLIQNLQKNTFTITMIVEIAVIIFSVFFSASFTRRLRRIMVSMRIIREGDYSQTVDMGGNDELTVLGDEFNELVDKLKTSEQKRNNFVSDASHELKTPLASIKLLSDSILQNDMDMDTAREFVEDIGNEADRLNRMTQKLLSLSRIETQADSDCEIINLAPTIHKVVRMLTGNAQSNQITVTTDIINDAPILILEDDLYQIIFNLVENGIKYNQPGGKLQITLNRNEDSAILTVQDTGVGIPEDALPHLFERFYRVDKARSRQTGGSGLGLSIVRNMIERNNGEISVESTHGQGSKFTVVFPAFDVEEEEL